MNFWNPFIRMGSRIVKTKRSGSVAFGYKTNEPEELLGYRWYGDSPVDRKIGMRPTKEMPKRKPDMMILGEGARHRIGPLGIIKSKVLLAERGKMDIAWGEKMKSQTTDIVLGRRSVEVPSRAKVQAKARAAERRIRGPVVERIVEDGMPLTVRKHDTKITAGILGTMGAATAPVGDTIAGKPVKRAIGRIGQKPRRTPTRPQKPRKGRRR